MNLGTIADQLAQVFGNATYAVSPDGMKARILTDFNAAIEAIQDAGEDFYGREDATIPLVTGQEKYTLDANIQTVLKPVRLGTGEVLTQVTSYGAFYRFASNFLDQLSPIVAQAKPTHYFVRSSRVTSSDDDSLGVGGEDVKIDILVAPAPTSVVAGTSTLLLQVIREPGLVTAEALAAGTANLSVPHKYVESIFLPIARYSAMGSSFFYDRDKVPHLEDDYMRALQLLGKSDPRRPKPGDSSDDAMEVRRPRGGQQQGGGG